MRAPARLVIAVAVLWPAAARGQIAPPPPPDASDAVERQRQQVRDTVNGPACRTDRLEEPDTIYVCGQGIDQSTGVRSAYRPPRDDYVAPDDGGPWFRFDIGPVAVRCCSVSGERGSAAGLGLGIRF